ncbi:MAG: 50S ribosomal protein L24 [Candidatus Magasanikbacteria bacterium RIFOXYD2_FULL_41_14]|uniref:Large ribosomal subunit protein uL24 n=1 Tax=Candidatus Magasanikbacteria bacterium RIFOXYD2_FULL_41_14 TaxID=1798709 RepID=A0A1F6PBZ0_9BACT|nr:MAG: 50S ribosomal protein L24 [Candidatus Magasanikbacteria bacterium RIFOXYD2_FULL_41_14]
MKIKVNDKVRVLTGKNKGKEGKVIQVFSTEGKVVVEGVNIMKKHLKTRKEGQKGQVIELAAPLATAKVMLICPKCNRPMRVAYKIEAGNKKRVCRLCKEFIE